jgi:hypothetical protein
LYLQHPALTEDYAQDERSDREEREHRQDIYNPGRHPPAADLALLVLPEFIEFVGLGHVDSLTDISRRRQPAAVRASTGGVSGSKQRVAGATITGTPATPFLAVAAAGWK